MQHKILKQKSNPINRADNCLLQPTGNWKIKLWYLCKCTMSIYKACTEYTLSGHYGDVWIKEVLTSFKGKPTLEAEVVFGEKSRSAFCGQKSRKWEVQFSYFFFLLPASYFLIIANRQIYSVHTPLPRLFFPFLASLYSILNSEINKKTLNPYIDSTYLKKN